MKKYFIINHFLKIDQNPKTASEIMVQAGGNLGNSYITYCLLKHLEIKLNDVEGIQNLWTIDDQEIEKNITNKFELYRCYL